MLAAVHEMTLTDVHMTAPYVRRADSFDRPPPRTEQWACSPIVFWKAGAQLGGVVTAAGVRQTSALSVQLPRSAREALDVSLQVEKERLFRKLEANLQDVATAQDVDAVSETVEFAYELLSRWGASSLNMHRTLEAKNPIHLAAVLRVSVDVKDRVPGWESALAYAADLTVRSGLDVDDALFGLM